MPIHDPDAPASVEDGIFGAEVDLQDAQVVLLPVPFDATVSYGHGAAYGPAAIKKASLQIDLYDVELGSPWKSGIHWRDAPAWVMASSQRARAFVERIHVHRESVSADHGEVHAASVAVNTYVEQEAERLIAAGKLVGVVGGDHSVPLGSIRAHARRHPGLGILHVDAHADLRRAYEGFTYSHASIMERVTAEAADVARLVQVGLRDVSESEVDLIRGSNGRIQAYFDAELARARVEGRLLEVFRAVASELPEQVYVSVDIDGLDPRFCPGTGTPVPGGLTFNELNLLLGELVRSGRSVLGFDLCEVAPHEGDREWNGNVGARVLYKLIGWAVISGTDH
ncbi:MAG: agmatinase family protein [Myxococcota bacterium]